jgi:hypothetical protein
MHESKFLLSWWLAVREQILESLAFVSWYHNVDGLSNGGLSLQFTQFRCLLRLLNECPHLSGFKHVLLDPVIVSNSLMLLGALTRRQSLVWNLGLALLSEGLGLSIIIELVFVIKIGQLLKVDLVSQHCSNATKALHKLVSFAGSVGDKFQGCAEVLVLFGEPLKE